MKPRLCGLCQNTGKSGINNGEHIIGEQNISRKQYIMAMRADFIFSYWVIAWYIAYMLDFTSYNPKWALAIGIILNIGFSILVLLKGGSIKSVIRFASVNLLIKGMSFYTIYNETTAIKDIYAILGLGVIYTLWLFINGTTPIKENNKLFQVILLGKKETPMIDLLSKII